MKNVMYTVLEFISRVSFIYRLIALGVIYFFISSSFTDVRFLSSYNNRKAFTIEELGNMPKQDIPKYIKVEKSLPLGSGIVTTFTKKGRVTSETYTYPVVSVDEFNDSSKAKIARVFFNTPYQKSDTSDTANLLKEFEGIEGAYDPDQNLAADAIQMLQAENIMVAENPIIITKGGSLPTMGGSATSLALSFLAFLLVAGSFLKNMFKPQEVA